MMNPRITPTLMNKMAQKASQRFMSTGLWKRSNGSNAPAKSGFDLLYGTEPVYAALQSQKRKEFGKIHVLSSILDGSGKGNSESRHQSRRSKRILSEINKLVDQHKIPVVSTSRHDLNTLSNQRPHNGVILEAAPLQFASLNGINLEKALENHESVSKTKQPIWVFLDEVMDPQNLGAIIRSCFYLGIYQLIICRKNSSPLSPVVSKASSGALEYMKIGYCESMPRFIQNCHLSGQFDIFGLDVSRDSVPLSEVSIRRPSILVVGNEGFGIRSSVKVHCDKLVHINSMAGDTAVCPNVQVDSLNVSNSVAVALYQLTSL